MWRDTVTKTRERFNPRAPCGARPAEVGEPLGDFAISIHAPLAGRDCSSVPSLCPRYISTHAPLAGRDRTHVKLGHDGRISTHAPLAGRDVFTKLIQTKKTNFNPRAPCGARHGRLAHILLAILYFNPRAPCGARLRTVVSFLRRKVFQPTRPLRGATIQAANINARTQISTHAPLAGRDSKSVQITMHIFAITDKFQMFLRKMPTVRAFCFFFVREKRANFSANRPDNFCALVLRTIRSSVPRADTSACSRSVRFYSRTSCPSSKIEGCPFLGQ